jgi:Mrp family chromosome partitioning ATPase
MFTSVDPGVGVSFLCSAITADLASRGKKVLLADAEAIAALGGVGLSRNVMSFCEPVGNKSAYVLRRRGSPLDDGFNGASASAILAALRKEFSYIVIDAPALSASSTALLFAAAADGIVLVAEAGKTETARFASICRKLISLGGRLYGSVLNTHASEEKGI